ncbi:MAG: hypothetical protein ABII12_06025 [Planctomycetota bacterium]
MSGSKQISRIIVLVFSCLMLAHFAIGIYLTSRLMFASDRPGAYAWFLLPYVGILGVFLLSGVLAYARRTRSSIAALLLGLSLSTAACVYDFTHARYQIGGGGTGATYTIWWWYYEPFWHGYEPGNL